MSLGQNLQFLRKQKDITQEQLAELLEVSRQSVSKWESDTTYPETDKLLQMTNLFHCTLDDLMQKDISTQYVEDKNHYDQHKNQFSKWITAGVGLILFGLTMCAFLSTVLPKREGLDRDMISTIVFFLFVVAAVAIFIVTGLQDSYFAKKHPFIEDFYSEEEKDNFHKKNIILITSGVVLIIVGLIIMMGTEAITLPEYIGKNKINLEDLMSSVFLLCVTIAVILFVYAGTQGSKYNIKHYNLMQDHNSQTYKNDKKKGLYCGCIMMVATMIFLACGYIGNLWKIAWVVYPIFGIFCGIIATIIDRNNNEEES